MELFLCKYIIFSASKPQVLFEAPSSKLRADNRTVVGRFLSKWVILFQKKKQE